jgi:hypothetical protein
MRRLAWLVPLGGAGAAAVVAGASLAASSAQPRAEHAWGAFSRAAHVAAVPRTPASVRLVVFTRNDSETDVDEPPQGFSQGDEVAVGAGLVMRTGASAGVLDVAGTATLATGRNARFQFTLTASLRGGQITATGVISAAEEPTGFTAAVTGGTGAYRGADGGVRVDFMQTRTRLTYDLAR